MSFVRSFFLSFLFLFYGLLVWRDSFAVLSEPKVKEKDPVHMTGERTLWNRRADVVELIGSAQVHQPGESISADYILFNKVERTVEAKGNAIYIADEMIIYGDKMFFDLSDRTGKVFGGRIVTKQFLLLADEIEKIGDNRYETKNAEYTACRDCAASWSFRGGEVSFEREGYLVMKNVTGNVKGMPVLWFPYMILPTKQDRQSGLLSPEFETSSLHGFTFMLPYFWAINRSADMTFGAGIYTARGPRLEWEGRYSLGKSSDGVANVFMIRDGSDELPITNRWAARIEQRHELPFGIDQRLRFYEISDQLYPIHFILDVPGRYDPVLTSEVFFMRNSSHASVALLARRHRNLLYFEDEDPTRFDPRTVQLFPRLIVSSHDRRVGSSPFLVGMDFNVSNFTRSASAFDYDLGSEEGSEFRPGIDPIRQAFRVGLMPSVYTTIRPWDVFSVVPSLHYRSYFYSFGGNLPSMNRGYLQLEAKTSFDLERVFEMSEGSRYSRLKHILSPNLSYSFIPFIHEPNHPFLDQIENQSAYVFDTQDVIPLGRSLSLNNYFVPQGHSVSYGLKTSLIGRRGEQGGVQGRYDQVLNFEGGQTLDLLELSEAEDERAIFSRFYSNLGLSLGSFQSNTQYFYYPSLERLLPDVPEDSRSPHEFQTGVSYVFERAMRQEFLRYDRSFSLSYNWRQLGPRLETNYLRGAFTFSLNDTIMPSVSAGYNLQHNVATGRAHGLNNLRFNLLIQSFSQCWQLGLDMTESGDRGWEIKPTISFNLTGDGFVSGFSEAGSRMSNRD
jgi:LPS-assembly protein